MVSGDGMESGVCVCACIARNCSRKDDTSATVKPAVSRRSKPRGAGVVDPGALVSPIADSRGAVADAGIAKVRSAASSSGESTTSPIEQWM